MAYKGLLMIAVPLILLLTFVGLVVHVKRQSESAQVLALHSDGSHQRLAVLLMHIAETESAVRGYVITGDERIRPPTSSRWRSSRRRRAQLRALVSDNPRQEARARTIEQLDGATNAAGCRRRLSG